MRRATPVLCLLLLMLPAATATTVTVSYPLDPDTAAAPVEVDLIEDAGGDVAWTFFVDDLMAEGACLADVPEGWVDTDASTATVTLTAAAEHSIALQRNVERHTESEGEERQRVVFRGSLPVDRPDIVVGDWAMDLVVRDRFGAEHDCGDARELSVVADDDDSPVVSFATGDADIRLRAGQSIQPTVTDALLGEVTYRVDRMPPDRFFTLRAPYILSAQSFFPGENELTLRATDRAGNPTTTVTVTVLVDDEPPELELNLTDRTPFFAGINNTIQVVVSDDSDFTGVARFRGVAVPFEGTGGQEQAVEVPVPAGNRTGTSTLQVRVEDAFGNVASVSRTVDVTQLTTDALVVDVVQDEEPSIVGDDVQLHVAMEQVEGPTAVNFTLRVDGEDLGTVLVPADGSTEATVAVAGLPPGRHNLSLVAEPPEGVLAKNQTNLTATVEVEVFLSSVLVDGDAFLVRVGDNGLPTAVVDEDGDAHDVELVQQGRRSVYAFEADDVEAFWDPAGPAEQEYVEPESPNEGDEESPGVGAVLVLLALGALAVAARRRP